ARLRWAISNIRRSADCSRRCSKPRSRCTSVYGMRSSRRAEMSLPAEHGPLLIVASSGRALAASAARSAQPVVVLDLYNDLDTRAYAVSSRAVASSGRFDAQRTLAAAAELCPPQRCAGLVYGSGLEARSGLLRKLARDRVLYGNEPETVALVKNPTRFFGLLDELHITYPTTSLHAPDDAEG